MACEGFLLGKRAKAGRFAEIFAAHVDARNDAVVIQAERYNDVPAIAGNGGLYYITHWIAIRVQRLVATVHPAVLTEIHLGKGGGRINQSSAGFFRSLNLVFLNGANRHLVGKGQKQRGDQADRNQQT